MTLKQIRWNTYMFLSGLFIIKHKKYIAGKNQKILSYFTYKKDESKKNHFYTSALYIEVQDYLVNDLDFDSIMNIIENKVSMFFKEYNADYELMQCVDDFTQYIVSSAYASYHN